MIPTLQENIDIHIAVLLDQRAGTPPVAAYRTLTVHRAQRHLRSDRRHASGEGWLDCVEVKRRRFAGPTVASAKRGVICGKHSAVNRGEGAGAPAEPSKEVEWISDSVGIEPRGGHCGPDVEHDALSLQIVLENPALQEACAEVAMPREGEFYDTIEKAA